MKKLTTLLFLALAISSCSVEELEIIEPQNNVAPEEIRTSQDTQISSIEEKVEIQQSKALRTTLEAIKENLNADLSIQKNKENQAAPLCFQFVYPLVVEFNDGSTEQLSNYEALLQVLLDESTTLHLTGIGFPFDVIEPDSEKAVTISNEEAFKGLIAACGYDEISYTDVINITSSCFSVIYPLDLIVNDHIKTFRNQEEAVDYFNKYWSSTTTVSISYPFRVTLHTVDGGERTSIENDFEMINLIKTTCSIE